MKIEKINPDEEIKKRMSESIVVFQMKNQAKVAYLIDFLTMKDVRRRLAGGISGVLKIGEDNKNRIDLNGVATILIDGEAYRRN